MLLFPGFWTVQAHDLSVRITIDPAKSPRVKVEGHSRKATKRWRFLNSYGRITGLGNRIQNLRLSDSGGQALTARRLSPGEFEADRDATEFSYEVDLAAPANADDAAHVSWLNGQYGYLMLADLLPDSDAEPLALELILPQNWIASSSAERRTKWSYELSDTTSAVFFVGANLKEKKKKVGSTEITFVTAGEWAFSRDAALDRAARIIKEHETRTGFALKRPVTVMLSGFQSVANGQVWSAETRGANLVLLANNDARFSLGQLSVALCHELFHLWVPNSLSLDGDFDWFFEGFTLYQALRTAIRLGFIDFQEYLATLGRVNASYLSNDHGDLSLIEASQRRWTSGTTLVYDQGMLVGFLLDLKLRSRSNNQINLDTVYQKLLQRYSSGGTRVDGNNALVSLLTELSGDGEFVKSYVQAGGVVELERLLPVYGLRVTSQGKRQVLFVAEPLNTEQRKLLTGLGYRKR